MAGAQKRLLREMQALQKEESTDFGASPKSDDNMKEWNAWVTGPAGSVYEGGKFELEMKVPDDYPFKPPDITFKTKIWHTAVQESGHFCIPILTTAKWSPQIKLAQVFVAIRASLENPEDGEANPEAAAMFKDQRAAYDKQAKEWTQKFAKA